MDIKIQNSIGFKINQVANKLNKSLTHVLKVYNIAPEQRAVLDLINENKVITQKDISALLQRDKTTISRSLNVLVKKEYLKKNESVEDKRVSYIILSKKGKDILDKTNESVNSFRKNINNSLSKVESETFLYLLNKINETVEEEL